MIRLLTMILPSISGNIPSKWIEIWLRQKRFLSRQKKLCKAISQNEIYKQNQYKAHQQRRSSKKPSRFHQISSSLELAAFHPTADQDWAVFHKRYFLIHKVSTCIVRVKAETDPDRLKIAICFDNSPCSLEAVKTVTLRKWPRLV